METLLVEAEVDELPGTLREGAGGGDSGVNSGMLGVKVTDDAEVPFGEHTVFDGPNTIDAPLIIGDGLGELALDGRAGVEAVDDFLGEGLISI